MNGVPSRRYVEPRTGSLADGCPYVALCPQTGVYPFALRGDLYEHFANHSRHLHKGVTLVNGAHENVPWTNALMTILFPSWVQHHDAHSVASRILSWFVVNDPSDALLIGTNLEAQPQTRAESRRTRRHRRSEEHDALRLANGSRGR